MYSKVLLLFVIIDVGLSIAGSIPQNNHLLNVIM